jgi:hypothetical protein
MSRRLLFFLVLWVAPFQVAHGAVIENTDVPYGPACNPPTQVCQLHITILGEVTSVDFDELKRLLDRTHREAESKKWEYDGPFVYLDTKGGSVSAAMAIGRVLPLQRPLTLDSQGEAPGVGPHPWLRPGSDFSRSRLSRRSQRAGSRRPVPKWLMKRILKLKASSDFRAFCIQRRWHNSI